MKRKLYNTKKLAIPCEFFGKLKNEYSSYYASLLRQGKLPMGSTEKGFWGYSIDDEVFELFTRIRLQKYNNFVDIGSGDGKVVLIASLFVKNAVGIECNSYLIKKSLEIKEKIGILNADFFLGDYFDYDVSGYDVIFCYPDEKINQIENKLIKEMKGILVHYGNHFFPQKLHKELQFKINDTAITVYSQKKS